MRYIIGSLVLLNLLAVASNVCFGSVSIPWSEFNDPRWHYIIWESRLPSALTAFLTGGALAVCGLLLQSYFRNPLAGPSILGITSGANLMVALVMIGGMGYGVFNISVMHGVSVVAAIIGALAILLLLLGLGKVVRSQATLLIIGMLISYLVSAVITLLNYYASAQGVQQLLIWGMGDFGKVGSQDLLLYTLLIIIGLTGSLFLIKPLNGWMQGELYALNLGIDPRRTRLLLLGVTGLLSAVTTAWCGPIAFVGLSMPHVARMLVRSDDHGKLLPVSLLSGGLCCSLCLLISTLPAGGTLLPINALTPFFGIPIILYVLIKSRS